MGVDGLQEFKGIFTTNNIPGMTSLNTNVFGGVVIGLMTAYLYNRFKTIQLPKALGFFSGVRFIPIVAIVCAMLLGILFGAI